MVEVAGPGRFAVVLALFLTGAATAAGKPEVLRFDTHGGDAWAFSKVVSGTITRDACDTVTLVSPSGRTNARIAQGRFAATVPLREGRNDISAICLRKGKRIDALARQSWVERLADTPSIRAMVADAADSTNQSPHGSEDAADSTNQSPRGSEDAADSTNQSPRGSEDAVDSGTQAPGGPRVAGAKAITSSSMAQEHPAWRSCTILYGVAPALMGNDGLAAVTRHLGQIARLGVTALLLSPITDAPPGDFGYALTDPFRVRANLGSSNELRALIRQAHALGIRVFLDFVTNHLSSQHPYFIDAARFGRHSPYFDWFERDPDGQPVHYFDWSSLENLNYGNAEVRNYMLAALTHWFRDFPIDGFRADAAWAVRDRDPAFWPLLRKEVERIRPGTLLIAEASARDPFYMSHGFDAAYDWTAELGHWAWQGVFGPPGQLPDLPLLRSALTNNGRAFSDSEGVLHFLNNNDTGKRFVTVHSLADTRVATVMLLTIPGVPLIYAGDEVGASFEPYAHPAPIEWDDPDHLLPLYTRLTRLRRELPALRSPQLRLIHTRHEESIMAYVREGSDPEQDVTVVLNFGNSSFDLQIASIQARSTAAAAWWAEDLLTGTRTVAPADSGSVRVSPHGALLLRRAARPAASTAGPRTISSSCSP